MSKYISLDALFENPDWQGWHDLSEEFKNGMENVMEYAENLPAIEVEPEAVGTLHKLPELKPCPFCGGRARFIYTRDGDYVYITHRTVGCMLVCAKCGAKMDAPGGYFQLVFGRDGAMRIEGDGREKLINAWNRRAKNEEGRKER